MKFNPTVVFVVVVRLCKLEWTALDSHDWFLYNYNTGKLSFDSSSAPMICNFANGTEEKVNGAKAILSIFSDAFATRGMSLKFAKAAWLQSLEKKVDAFEFPLLEAQVALLKRISNDEAFVAEEGQPFLTAAANTDAPVDDDGDWDLDGAVGLHDVERVVVKQRLRDFKYSFFAKKSTVPGTIANAF